MKLASINHPEHEILDEGLREKLLAGVAGAGITAAGMLGGQALLNKSDSGSTAPSATKMSQEESAFWSTGTTQRPDGTMVAQELGESRGEAEARARDALAQFMGVKRLPPGLRGNVEEMDGIFKATVTYSPEASDQAAKFGQQMRDSKIVQDY